MGDRDAHEDEPKGGMPADGGMPITPRATTRRAVSQHAHAMALDRFLQHLKEDRIMVTDEVIQAWMETSTGAQRTHTRLVFKQALHLIGRITVAMAKLEELEGQV